MTYGACVSGGEKLAVEEMNADTARDTSKLSSCKCTDATCPKGHGSKGCDVRMANGCQVCNEHKENKQSKK